MRILILLMSLALAAGPQPARADDADALALADSAPVKAKTASDWRWYAEAAFGQATPRNGGSATRNERLSLDLQLDKSFAPDWRAIVSDRLDVNWPAQGADQRAIHTIREAYLSWQAQADQIVDLGRVNARNGVALGYNPTDFFRDGAIRSVVSVDPSSLKTNRQGSVMLRGQTLWSGASLTALYAPKLAEQPNGAGFNPDWGATNGQNRWLVSASRQFTENLNPQGLLFGAQGQSPQLGLNLTTLIGDATVVFLEWSGGRSRTQLSQALNAVDDTAFRHRLATGATYTSEDKFSLTLEYDYNGAALDDATWSALMRGSPLVYGQYRIWVQNAQELPSQQAAFLYATWQDAVVKHLDLNAMLRFNVADHSHLSWLEARYHWDRADLALQWQFNNGSVGSEFGATTQQKAWQALVRYYF